MNIRVKQGDLNKEATEVLVLGGYEDDQTLPKAAQALDHALGGQLQELRTSGEFSGNNQQSVLIHTRGALPAKRILLMGLGEKKDVTLDRVRQALGTASKKVRQTGANAFSATMLGVEALHNTPVADMVQAMVEGAILGDYRFTHYQSDKKETSKNIKSLTLLATIAKQVAGINTGVMRGEASANATAFARDLCNHPANIMTPSRVVHEAKKITKGSKVQLTVLDHKDQERLGMGGMLGVSRGSQEAAKFLILDYAGGKKKEAPIVLVGKTVTFDSGGISLKPSENMERMKADMTGGAEVLGAVQAAVTLRLPLNLVGILPATENMPGGRATKPGDILHMLNGKTVEVQNTDAEGRLILADGLAYATRLKPKYVVDVATLTGACIVALGHFAIGMLGNDDQLKAALKTAGEQAGERVWEMPLWDEYFEQLKSDVADMRNIGGRGGGMITAGMFLRQFVGHCPWVHLDIASTDWSTSERPYLSKGPTAIGTRLLVQFLINQARHS